MTFFEVGKDSCRGVSRPCMRRPPFSGFPASTTVTSAICSEPGPGAEIVRDLGSARSVGARHSRRMNKKVRCRITFSLARKALKKPATEMRGRGAGAQPPHAHRMGTSFRAQDGGAPATSGFMTSDSFPIPIHFLEMLAYSLSDCYDLTFPEPSPPEKKTENVDKDMTGRIRTPVCGCASLIILSLIPERDHNLKYSLRESRFRAFS